MNDLEVVAGLLDRIIASKDPDIKDAFEELLIVVALKQEKDVFGPLSTLVREYAFLKDRIIKLETEMTYYRGRRVNINQDMDPYIDPYKAYRAALETKSLSHSDPQWSLKGFFRDT